MKLRSVFVPFWLSWLKQWSYEPKILGSNPRRGIHFLLIDRRLRLIRQTAIPDHDFSIRHLGLGGQKPAGADPQLHVLHKQAVQLDLVLHVLLHVVGLGLRVHDGHAFGLEVVLRLEDAVELVESGHFGVGGGGVYIFGTKNMRARTCDEPFSFITGLLFLNLFRFVNNMPIKQQEYT